MTYPDIISQSPLAVANRRIAELEAEVQVLRLAVTTEDHLALLAEVARLDDKALEDYNEGYQHGLDDGWDNGYDAAQED